MRVRCKFQLQEIRQYCYGNTAKTYVFRACYDTSIPEDQRFCKATPSGELTIMIDNPAVNYELGKYYYFESEPVEAVVAQ